MCNHGECFGSKETDKEYTERKCNCEIAVILSFLITCISDIVNPLLTLSMSCYRVISAPNNIVHHTLGDRGTISNVTLKSMT